METSSLTDLVFQQCSKAPDLVAVTVVDQSTVSSITFSELRKGVSMFSIWLKDKLLIAHQEVIAVCCQQRLSSIISQLSIMMACAVYLPLDLSWSKDTVSDLLTRLKFRYLICDSPILPFDLDIEDSGNYSILGTDLWVLCLKHVPHESAFKIHNTSFPASTKNFSCDNEPAECTKFAYVMPTSGTTSRSPSTEITFPTVVLVPHRSVIHCLSSLNNLLGVQPTDSILQCSAPVFDLSIFEVFFSMLAGARVVCFSDDILNSPSKCAKAIKDHNISLLQCTPSFFRRLPQSLFSSCIVPNGSLRVLALGGEPCPSLAELSHIVSPPQRSHTPTLIHPQTLKVFNLYGTTELSIWALASPIDFTILEPCCDLTSISKFDSQMMSDIPLGTPLKGVGVVVFAKENDSCTLNSEAINDAEVLFRSFGGKSSHQIDVSPPQWWQEKIETAAPSSCVNPKVINDGGKFGHLWIGGSERICQTLNDEELHVYRSTGDRVFVCMHGNLFYAGRYDTRIKVLGKSLHLDSLTLFLNSCSDVRSSACVFDEERQIIHAFIVPAEPTPSNLVEVLTSFCQSKLHQYMIPAKWHLVSTLPLTHNHKVDMKKLWNDAQHLQSLPKIESENDILCYLWDLWRNEVPCVLSLDHENDSNTFFLAIGGSSVSANKLSHEVMRDLFYELEMHKKEDYSQLQTTIVLLMLEQSLSKCSVAIWNMMQDQRCISSSMSIEDELHSLVTKSDVDVRKRIISHAVSYVSLGRPEIESHVLEKETLKLLPNYSFEEEWVSDIGGKCVDTTALALISDLGTLIFIGGHSGEFHCILSGSSLWCVNLGHRIESSPTMSSDFQHLYVGCNDGRLYALDATCGDIEWFFQTNGEIKASPCVHHNLIWFGSYDGKLYGIDSKCGDLRFQFSCGGMISTSVMHHHDSPQLYYSCNFKGGSTVFSMVYDDTEIGTSWKVSFSAPIFGRVVLDYTLGWLFFGCCDKNLYALRESSGEIVWKFVTPSPIFSSCLLSGDAVVFGSSSRLYCVNRVLGKKIWNCDLLGMIQTPTVTSDQGKLIVASSEGHLYLIVQDSGCILTQTALTKEVFSSPVAYCCGDYVCVIVGCRDNKVHSYILRKS